MIIRRQFYPYIAYLVTVIWYLSVALADHGNEDKQAYQIYIAVLGVATLSQWLNQARSEYI